ncbi:MAG: hypothetical protein JW836_08390 [Deltaproteobacteria bacterium]|nr:hypothetical protein [Deltaproteobacteria bacterium]
MRAKLVFHTKTIKGDEIVEVRIWEIPRSLHKPHGIKFSVVYVKGGKRLGGYDNAEQKGYHRHFLDNDEPYEFVNIWKLIEDFRSDLERIRGRNWNED